ncbi:hypothetical protein BLL42_17210 [Pseudomonas frederiksbergensis]|uniref:Uncharacterized protein n=1 Tax=Pseudomonas frederiksbergensis TaxID=104087 RepID=A0A1J0ENH6_9PSED|nr:hypothetical protein [Pseudomonas frederiksbergensis]APC17392.1 hypothetical protein BLL42_17210 [Pseudomonas frederiksbergensis]
MVKFTNLESIFELANPETVFEFKNQETILESKSNLSLDTIIENSLTSLKDILEIVRPDDNFNEVLDEVSCAIEDEKTNHETLITLNFESVFPGTELPRKNDALFCLACAACLQAKKLNISDNKNKAWALITYANQLIGQAMESFNQEHKANEALSRQRKGGEATKEKHLIVRDEMIRLLRELAPPPTGWKNKKQAAEVIGEALERFIMEKGLGTIITDPEATAKNWLYALKETEIQEAFKASSTKHKTQKTEEPLTYSILRMQVTR